MGPRARALAVDLGLALGAVLAGGLSGGLEPTPAGIASLVLAAASMAAACYLAEQTPILDRIATARPTSLVVVGLVTFALTLALGLGAILLSHPFAVVLGGLGAGLCCYRAVYGLLLPLPRHRLHQVGADDRFAGVEPP